MSWLFSEIGRLVVDALNALIAALAAAVAAVLGILPAMPTFPALPSQFTAVMGWINWFFPVGTVLDIITFFIAAWLTWLVVRTVLAWAKMGAA